jgi:two-component system, NarL family, response regulator LiaR
MQNRILMRHKQIILYGIALAGLLFLLKWLELRFLIINHSQQVFTGSIALIFTALGIWLALKLSRPRVEKIIVEREVKVHKAEFTFNQEEAERLNISKREVEVLALMSQGLSNQEIADKMFVSLNTVKTHSKNLFEKLDVVRRTQAVQKGKDLRLIE